MFRSGKQKTGEDGEPGRIKLMYGIGKLTFLMVCVSVSRERGLNSRGPEREAGVEVGGLG
jgi:hypothetical protein